MATPRFRTRTGAGPAPTTPEHLYDELAKAKGAPEALWAHQADVLRAYHAHHLRTPDIALELPTGAGKTIPGLLVAEWRRRSLGDRVLYACPTQQLARQVSDAARTVGIDAVTLVGRHGDWGTANKLRYESARAIGITTYSTVFNVVPALEPAQTLLFDDAHAAEQFVAGAWSVEVRRGDDPVLHASLVEVLQRGLSGVTHQMLTEPDEPLRRPVYLVGNKQVRELAGRLRDEFRHLTKDDDLYWRLEAIGDRLAACQVYVSWDAVLIRPWIPPTAGHRHFTRADQRVYLSATLGDGGELERSFGRSPISRLAIPEGWDSRGAGRRFFVFPDLQRELPPRELARAVVAEAGKALVLAASANRATWAADLAPDGADVMGPSGSPEALLAGFRRNPAALLTLANRYDGLDLPDAQCRVTVLDGMPTGAHLQERFLSDTLLTGRVLRERTRTRVVQGAGRCARGLSDHSIVIVLGDSLTRFLGLPDVHDALRPELQAEVDFGVENSDVPADELLGFARSFLDQDDEWREQAEPALLAARRSAVRKVPPENVELAAAAAHEVTAVDALWAGEWTRASEAAQNVAGALSSPGLDAYRSMWLYNAAAWLDAAADEGGDPSRRKAAAALLRKAYSAGRSSSWLRNVQALPDGELHLDGADVDAVARAVTHGPLRLSGRRWADLHQETLAGLGQTAAGPYERALVRLGPLLGAESSKPAGQGRTDCAWAWASWWLAVEAKTEETADAPLSQAAVRQANGQLKTLAHDRQEPVPAESAVVIVGPRQLVHPLAAVEAEPFVHLTSPQAVLDLARDAVTAWKEIRAQGSGLGDEDLTGLVAGTMADYAVLPSDVRTRLLANAVHG